MVCGRTVKGVLMVELAFTMVQHMVAAGLLSQTGALMTSGTGAQPAASIVAQELVVMVLGVLEQGLALTVGTVAVARMAGLLAVAAMLAIRTLVRMLVGQLVVVGVVVAVSGMSTSNRMIGRATRSQIATTTPSSDSADIG